MSIFSCLSCLSTDNKTRPLLSLTVEKISQKAIYDTGASISLLSTKAWRKILPENRPSKLQVGLTAVSASGEKLQLQGCYLLRTKVLGKTVTHPFYVCDNLKTDVLLGIDYIKAAGLNYDAISSEVYLANYDDSDNVNLVTRKDNYIMPRSGLLVSTQIQTPKVRQISNTFAIDLEVEGCPQIAKNDVMVEANDDGFCSVYLVNAGVTPLRIPKGSKIGHGYAIPENMIFEVDSIELEKDTKTKYDNFKRKQQLKSILNLDHLTSEMQSRYTDLLCKYHDVFSLYENDLGECKLGEHSIPLNDTNPAYINQFPLPEAHRDEVINSVKEWLNLGIIERADSAYNAPVFVVPKKKGLSDPQGNQQMTFRTVTDFRLLNSRTVPQKYRLPLISECLDEVGRSQATLFSSFDMKGAFFQVKVKPSDRHKTAFTVPNMGTFQYVRCPFGLSSMPLTMQKISNKCFEGLTPHILSIYLDDGLVKARSHEEMLKNLDICFDRLRKANLKLSPQKCKFGVDETTFLGFTINKDGYRPNKSKLKAIEACTPPATAKQIRSWLGMTGFFRRSIPNYAKLAKPLSRLTCKDSQWSGGTLPPDALKSFKTLKELLVQEPVLGFPLPNMPYQLYVDGSQGTAGEKDGGIAGCLVQIQNGAPKVIGYCSRSLLKHEKAYTSHMCEMLAASFSIDYFSVYLTGRQFTLFSDSIPVTKVTKAQNRTLNRLQYQMLQYNFKHEYIPGHMNPSDYCSRQVAEIITQQKLEDSKLPYLSDSDFVALQNEDPFICALKTYVQTKRLSSSLTPLRSLVKRYGPSCALHKGILCILLERPGYQKRWLKVAPAILHADIIASAHANQFCGHGKNFKTTERILQCYWWPGCQIDSEEFIKSCSTCQKAEKRHLPPNTNLKPIELPSTIFEKLNVDLFGPLRTNSGKKFIMTMVDPFSKHAEFCALSSKEPEVVAKALFDRWICRFGVVDIMISDKGAEFCSKLSQELYNLLGIDKRSTTSRHPMTNGSAEILNKHIAKFLTSMLDKNVLDWENLLPALQFSYNCSTNKSNKMTPFFLMYGKHPKTPFFDPNFSEQIMYGENYAQSLMNRLKLARKLAIENNRKFQDKNTSNYDKNVKKIDFQEGSLVLLHRPEINKTNPKICKQWEGPYLVVSLPNETNALIQDLKSGKSRFVHKNRIKPFLGPLQTSHNNKNAGLESADTPALQNAKVQKSDTCPTKYIRIESDDIVVLNPDDPAPQPIPVKAEDQSSISSSEDHIVVKEEALSPQSSLSPAKFIRNKVQQLRDNFHIPSTSEVGESFLPRGSAARSSSSRVTRQKAKNDGIKIDDNPLPPRPIEYKGKTKK